MAMIKCPECGNEISEQADVCPNCGYPIKKHAKRINPKIVFLLIIVGIILLVAIIGIYKAIKRNKLIDAEIEQVEACLDNHNFKEAKKYYHKYESDASFSKRIEPRLQDRYENLLAKNDISGIMDLWKSGTLSDEYLNVKRNEIVEKLQQIQDDYVSGKISEKDGEKICNHYTNFPDEKIRSKNEQVKDYIKKLDSSRKAFDKGETFEKENDYESAINEYEKVIQEDKENYNVASKKIEEIKPKIINEYKENAASAEKKKNYKDALSEIDKALILAPDDKDIEKLRDLYQKELDEYNEKRKEEELKKMLLTEGKTIAGKNIEAKFLGAKLTNSVTPDNTSGTYFYYSPQDSSQMYLDIRFRIKNISDSEIDLDSIVQGLKATYDNKYTYDTYSEFYSDSNRIENVYMWSSIDPLQETTFHVALILPKEVKNSDATISVNFELDGEKQILNFR